MLPAAMILLVGVALTLTISHGAGHGPDRPAPVSRPSAPASSPGTATPRVPHLNLTGLRWSDYHGVELPSSPAAGPRHTGSGLASGFADTPLGALLAAVNIGVRANAQWDRRLHPHHPGPGNRSWNGRTAGRLPVRLPPGQPGRAPGRGPSLGDVYVAEEAFRWIAYTPADATVDLVSAGLGNQGQTVRAVTQVEAVWDAGDWRVVAPPGGDWGNAATRLSSLAGYTMFPVRGDRRCPAQP